MGCSGSEQVTDYQLPVVCEWLRVRLF